MSDLCGHVQFKYDEDRRSWACVVCHKRVTMTSLRVAVFEALDAGEHFDSLAILRKIADDQIFNR